MPGSSSLESILSREFELRHVNSAIEHFNGAADSFVAGNWEAVEQKAGKFVEAISKALVIKSGKSITDLRHYSAGAELRKLENVNGFPDPLRLVIPRAGIFVYEIVSNRGGRHDAHDIDANEMDAKVVMPIISWILAEMVRYCAKTDPDEAHKLIAELTDKRFPAFEEIEGRSYVNFEKLKAGQVALLIMYFLYPRRIERAQLIEAVVRHNVDRSAARSGVDRLRDIVDFADNSMQLRGIGREKAELLLQELRRDKDREEGAA